MNISKKTSSVSGSKYIKIAASMASKLKLKFQTTRSIIDGFILEAKKAGKLRTATVIDLPQDLVLFPVNLVRINNSYAIKPFTCSIPNRDTISPNVDTSLVVVNYKHDGAVTKQITFGNVSAMNFLQYQGIVVTQPFCMTQTFMFHSGDQSELNQVVIQANFINSGPPTKNIVSYQIGGDKLHQLLQKDLMPMRVTTDREPATGNQVFYMSARDNNPVSWYSGGKCYTIINTYDNYHYDVPYDSFYLNHYYSTFVSHLALVVVSYDEDSEGYDISAEHLNIDSFLPAWLLGDDVRLTRSSSDSSILVKAAREYKIHSVRELPDGKIVIASTMKKLVPIEDIGQWSSKVWSTNENNELAYHALVSLKIVIESGQVLSVDVMDADVLCGQNFYDGILTLPPFSNINRNSLCADMMLDVLSNGSILCRRQIIARPTRHESIPYGGYYNLTSPHYSMTIDGQYREPISSNESSASYISSLYILEISTSPIYMGQNNSSRISNDITVVQWYEPKPEGGISTIGLMFVDTKEDRFKIELAGYPNVMSDVIGVSCPQEEVRDAEGKLITPSVIIAVLQKDSDFVVMVRKGPIFGEGSVEEDCWSEPIPIEEFITIGVLYAKGSSFSNKEHGQYFHNRVEV